MHYPELGNPNRFFLVKIFKMSAHEGVEEEKTNQSAESGCNATQEAASPASSAEMTIPVRQEQEPFPELVQELPSGETHETTTRSFSKRVRDDVEDDSISLRVLENLPAIKSESCS